MGRPNVLKPRPPAGTSRRGFFQRSGSAAVALASVAALPLSAGKASAAAADQRRGTGVFQHGVASGDPLSNAVVLWTRITPAATRGAPQASHAVRFELATDPAFTNIVARGATTTDAARDYTVKVDPARLRPATTYYYRFHAEGETSPIGRTRTLPVGATPRLRIAVASCSNHAAGYFNAYRRIAERADLDLVLHLGDYLYEYGPNEYGSVRTPEPAREMVTLTDYRLRHAQYKRDADLQAVHRQHPMVCIWDDHEVTNDAWVGGAENHTEGAEGTWPERVNVALQAYYEWMPIRTPDVRPGTPDLRRNQRAFRIGDLVELVMLEERLSARSQQLAATVPTPFGNGFVQTGEFLNPARTLLGAEQEAWLAARLRQTPARWKFIGQGVMFAQLKLQGAPLAAGGGVFVNTDQWDGYQPARDRLYDVLKGSNGQPGVDNVVVLTGDIHSSWAADLTQDPNNANVAGGGYNPATGEGSRAVEFVCTSITSPGLPDPNGSTAAFLRGVNPHFKHIEFTQRGYMLLDVTPARTVCEWWTVDTVASVSNVQTFATAFEVAHGSNRLQPSAQTTPPANVPPLAP
jgi:alkaline phosphatase D